MVRSWHVIPRQPSDWSIWQMYKIMPNLEDLHYAIKLQDIRKIKLLISYCMIDVNSSLRSCTALSLAVYQGSVDCVRMLLECGACPNKLSRDWNGRIETPLFSACRLREFQIAKSLILAGADVNLTDFYNQTPLWIATRERDLEMVKLLVESGSDLDMADKWSQCPLYLATKYFGRSEIAKFLIKNGCKLNLTDPEGRGAIYWSLANHQVEVFKMLLQSGAHITPKDREYMCGRKMRAEIRENADFCDWLDSELKTPPSLLRLARNGIRKHLKEVVGGTTIIPKIEQLPVSKKMQEFLKFQ